jgi:hypothetical protein
MALLWRDAAPHEHMSIANLWQLKEHLFNTKEFRKALLFDKSAMDEGVLKVFHHNHGHDKPKFLVGSEGKGPGRKIVGFALVSPHDCLLSGQSYYCLQEFFIPPDRQLMGEARAFLPGWLSKHNCRVLVPPDEADPEVRASPAFFKNIGLQELPYKVWNRIAPMTASGAGHSDLRRDPDGSKGVIIACQTQGRISVMDGDFHVRALRHSDLNLEKNLTFVGDWLAEIGRVLQMDVAQSRAIDAIRYAMHVEDPYRGKLYGVWLKGMLIGAAKIQLQYDAFNSQIAYIRHPYVVEGFRSNGVCRVLSRGMLAIEHPPNLVQVRIVLPNKVRCAGEGFQENSAVFMSSNVA